MKAVILAGGRGSRIEEESATRPKPMVTIGDNPILWHIMRIFAAHGVQDFVICLGYKGYMIKEYFANYMLHSAGITHIDYAENKVSYEGIQAEPWRVTLVETGLATQTGGRIKRIREFVGEGDFFLTYGDGVADIDIGALLDVHRREGRHATVTAVSPPGRFGALSLVGNEVRHFMEKPEGDNRLINGGFFVLSPAVFDYIGSDETVWEHEPLQNLAADGQLSAYVHNGFWQPMDTMRDREVLEKLWASGKAPWVVGNP